jgi:alkanesulfonate monooxygenase SsuD/methylene tetrahydromethanopterin reductase-like flavin-dependent oxidoreductase (luciferase family)
MMKLTAKWADAWNTAWFGGVDDLVRQRLADLDAACDAVGRDRSEIRRTIGIRVFDPGERGDDARSTDADAAGLADIFDELEGAGFADAIVWSISKSPAAIDRIGEARRIHVDRRA